MEVFLIFDLNVFKKYRKKCPQSKVVNMTTLDSFKCRFYGYIDLFNSISEIPVHNRRKILKIAICMLCKNKLKHEDEGIINEIEYFTNEVACVPHKNKNIRF